MNVGFSARRFEPIQTQGFFDPFEGIIKKISDPIIKPIEQILDPIGDGIRDLISDPIKRLEAAAKRASDDAKKVVETIGNTGRDEVEKWSETAGNVIKNVGGGNRPGILGYVETGIDNINRLFSFSGGYTYILLGGLGVSALLLIVILRR